ncbi:MULTISPECIES: class I SAM-dependent methyltransferase [unclassified Coleofasciculus]|uniref:class I SAM-dependent methyltransferase n=1 Tax=unclassified Coleofasciculus TaxID=2692782 RepID=UPI001880554C|nr:MULTISPECIES: class I SAM-dependent methyltransferase [unclassified Coleofasciculus]MBE9128954.1 class I SAM-dependent methyltransferase [Coleofasciculus sp. LEGE 07081]MBE9148281.1 class I SAM-dependent methyltransferase [Coleofasciculus sp. LEGE 07092]
MFEQQPENLRQKVKSLATEALDKSDPSGWFEVLYSEANENPEQVPWAKLTPHPYLQDWLDRYQIQGDNRCVLVIGCGLGDDAEALARLGFKVTAFDISPTAIAWCQKRFPDSSVNYLVANLFAPNPEWHRAFDLVVESRNIQALPLNVRSEVIEAIASWVTKGGTLLVITRFRDTDAEPDGPPWHLSESELAQFKELGFSEIRRDTFIEEENPSITQLRIEYQAIMNYKL